jgi:hypothetical protein
VKKSLTIPAGIRSPRWSKCSSSLHTAFLGQRFCSLRRKKGVARKRLTVPAELGLDEALGSQGLSSLDDLEVGDVELDMLGRIEVLLSDKHALCCNYHESATKTKTRSFEERVGLLRTFEELQIVPSDSVPIARNREVCRQ